MRPSRPVAPVLLGVPFPVALLPVMGAPVTGAPVMGGSVGPPLDVGSELSNEQPPTVACAGDLLEQAASAPAAKSSAAARPKAHGRPPGCAQLLRSRPIET